MTQSGNANRRFGLAGLSIGLAGLALAAAPVQAQTVSKDELANVGVAGDDANDLGPRKPAKPAPPETFPRLSNGKPDFTGVWFAGVKDLVSLDDSAMPIPLTPEYQAVRQKRIAATEAGKPDPDFVSTCWAFGMPRIMTYGMFEFVARPEQLWMITEVLHEVRRIYIDDAPHGQYQEKSFGGVSTAKWDGDTLVVETTKLRAGYLNRSSAPHSDQMTITERIRMVNKDALENEITIRDPVALTQPFVLLERYDRRPKDYEIGEMICMENYRSGGGQVMKPENDPTSMLPKSATSDEE